MASHVLTLYRRHTKTCIHGYPQNYRIYRPATAKERRDDCRCPIMASGTLRNEARRIQHCDTRTDDWEKAEGVKRLWESWQALTDPNPPVETEQPTVEEAIANFFAFHGAAGKEWTPSYLQKFEHLFKLRLIPFCEERKLTHIHAFERASLVTEFFTSWRNANPSKNRKQPAIDKPLAYRTKVKELERFRYVLRWFVKQGWLRVNHAADIKLKYEPADAKFGLLPEEEDIVFATIAELEDCRHQKNQRNMLETYAICMVMRHAGLRISDAVALDESQLIPRASGNGYALNVYQKKTKAWVRIPITMETYEALTSLPFKGSCDGKMYWFRTGEGTLKTAITVWRKRLTQLFEKAQKNRAFQHHATPHTWRHTFAIAHLNAGTEIKMVSRWLGHKSVAVTEQHYAHANHATNIASEAAYDESQRKQAARRKFQSVAKVVSIAG